MRWDGLVVRILDDGLSIDVYGMIRDGIVIRDGLTIESLRRIKDDASEVRSGLECGLKLAGFDDVEVGDKIEAYEMIEVSRTLAGVEAVVR